MPLTPHFPSSRAAGRDSAGDRPLTNKLTLLTADDITVSLILLNPKQLNRNSLRLAEDPGASHAIKYSQISPLAGTWLRCRVQKALARGVEDFGCR
jgi:hypothetical protein